MPSQAGIEKLAAVLVKALSEYEGAEKPYVHVAGYSVTLDGNFDMLQIAEWLLKLDYGNL